MGSVPIPWRRAIRQSPGFPVSGPSPFFLHVEAKKSITFAQGEPKVAVRSNVEGSRAAERGVCRDFGYVFGCRFFTIPAPGINLKIKSEPATHQLSLG